jgi:hypothetical protein
VVKLARIWATRGGHCPRRTSATTTSSQPMLRNATRSIRWVSESVCVQEEKAIWDKAHEAKADVDGGAVESDVSDTGSDISDPHSSDLEESVVDAPTPERKASKPAVPSAEPSKPLTAYSFFAMDKPPNVQTVPLLTMCMYGCVRVCVIGENTQSQGSTSWPKSRAAVAQLDQGRTQALRTDGAE